MNLRAAWKALLSQRATKFTGGSPQSPSYWVKKLFYGNAVDALSGVTVDEDKALTISAVWSAINIISGAIGFLPAFIYKRKPGGGRERADEHPAFKLVHKQANPYMGAGVYRETKQAHLLAWGNAHSEIQINGAGTPIALWPIAPNTIDPEVQPDKTTLLYRVNRDGRTVYIEPDRIIHLKGLGFDGLKGYSVIHYAAESMGLTIASEGYGAAFFGNAARPSGVLEHPQSLSKEAQDRLKVSWQEQYGGYAKAGGIMVAEEGMQWKPMTMPNEDAQFLQTREFQVNDIARWFQIPPHLIGDLRRATFTNIEHQGIEFVRWTLARWLKRWEEELTAKLCGVDSEYYVEFETAALLRGDTTSRYAAYNTAINSGWLNRNEVREMENSNRVDGLDEFLQPLNMTKPGDEPKDELPAKPDTDNLAEPGAASRLWSDTWGRIVRAETRALDKMARHNLLTPEAISGFYEKHAIFMTRLLSPVWDVMGGDEAELEERVGEWCATHRAEIGGANGNCAAVLSAWEAVVPEWKEKA